MYPSGPGYRSSFQPRGELGTGLLHDLVVMAIRLGKEAAFGVECAGAGSRSDVSARGDRGNRRHLHFVSAGQESFHASEPDGLIYLYSCACSGCSHQQACGRSPPF